MAKLLLWTGDILEIIESLFYDIFIWATDVYKKFL